MKDPEILFWKCMEEIQFRIDDLKNIIEKLAADITKVDEIGGDLPQWKKLACQKNNLLLSLKVDAEILLESVESPTGFFKGANLFDIVVSSLEQLRMIDE